MRSIPPFLGSRFDASNLRFGPQSVLPPEGGITPSNHRSARRSPHDRHQSGPMTQRSGHKSLKMREAERPSGGAESAISTSSPAPTSGAWRWRPRSQHHPARNRSTTSSGALVQHLSDPTTVRARAPRNRQHSLTGGPAPRQRHGNGSSTSWMQRRRRRDRLRTGWSEAAPGDPQLARAMRA